MRVKQADNFFYRITENQTEALICSNLNTNKSSVLRNNPKLNYYAGEWVKITTNEYLTHIVKPTETIESIAKKYNIAAEKILADNGLESAKLFIGQQLKIFNN